MTDLAEIEKTKEIESIQLSSLAWKDVQSYQEGLRKANRESIAGRLVASRRQQAAALEIYQKQLESIHNELEARYNDWVDVTNYKLKENNKKRESIHLRIDSWKQQCLAEEKLLAKKQMIEEENIRYREQDWEDLNNAKDLLKLEERNNLIKGKMLL